MRVHDKNKEVEAETGHALESYTAASLHFEEQVITGLLRSAVVMCASVR